LMRGKLMESKKRGKEEAVLLLGMVYSEEIRPKRGQEYRDRIRCIALEKLGYNVKTLDNKHDATILPDNRHCTSNFADGRRFVKAIKSNWEGLIFDSIILDYFFSPVKYSYIKLLLLSLNRSIYSKFIGRLG
jgi:hypothetical protein